MTTVTHAQNNCSCTNCPQYMPDNFQGNFLIQVQNAANPILGQNGQGVCGVTLHFDHEYIGDLLITLTSPAGQTVTLIGPIGLFGETDGTTWDITFVPCADAANPDPGFNATWSNNQNWGLLGNYTGSYYPYTGCLENFNTGPVNGQWTLSVLDGQNNDVGNFYDYQIIFCDPTNIECFSCEANAGNLLQSDITACEGDPVLNMDLPPTYTPQQPAPPQPDYLYTYVIATGGIITAYEPGPDLSGYPAGAYTVCGLSYRANDENDIPPPNGSLTIAQLAAQLNSSSPPFCGKITVNCLNVNILPLPPDIDDYETICAPGCVDYYGEQFCSAGDHTVMLDQNGCPYTATLHLTLLQPALKTVFETICPGTCSQTPGFENACTAGQHTQIFAGSNGCDSIVTLNLNIVSATAAIPPPLPLSCTQTTLTLQSTGSTPTAAGVSYQWSASNGGNLSGPANQTTATATSPGNYRLIVCKASGSVVCCDTAFATVTADQNPPAAPAGISGPNQVCSGQNITLQADSVPGVSIYNWSAPASTSILSGQGTSTVNLSWGSDSLGTVCASAQNACGTSAPVCISIGLAPPPTAPVGITGPTQVCNGQAITLQADTVPGVGVYNWSVPVSSTITSGQGTPTLTLNWGSDSTGNVCVNAQTACGISTPTCVSVSLAPAPTAPAPTGPTLVCSGDTLRYSVPNISAGDSLYWILPSSANLVFGQYTDTVGLVWQGNAGGNLCLTISNDCGTSIPACIAVQTVAPLPNSDISGPDTLCTAATGLYSFQPSPAITGFLWKISGGSILGKSDTAAIAVAWGLPNAGTVCLEVWDSCGQISTTCMPVWLKPLPVADAGTDQLVCGQLAELNANPGSADSTGLWSFVTGPGTAVIADTNFAVTSATVSAAGIYRFQWREWVDGCSGIDTVEIQFNPVPATGTVELDCDSTEENYSVRFSISGGTPPYEVNGALIPTGTYVSTLIPAGAPYEFQVTDSNGCAASPLNGLHVCNCHSFSGLMSTDILSACSGDTVSAVHLGGQMLDGNDTMIYVMHTSPNSSLGQVLASNQDGRFGFQPGMYYDSTYYISVLVGTAINGQLDFTDPCLSVSAGQPLQFHAYPNPNAGPDTALCSQVIQLSAEAGTGTWSLSTSPSGSNLLFSDMQNPNAQVTASQFGSYVLTWSVTQQGCTAVDSVTLIFNETPQLLDLKYLCDSANEYYSIQLNIGGGTPPYFLNAVPLNGNTFSSPPIASGQSYNYLISDGNTCTLPPITDTHVCDCITFAGTLNAQLLSACASDSIFVVSNGDIVLDGNDTLLYVLYAGSGPVSGQVIASNSSGVFAFIPGMNYNEIYHVAIIVGNKKNGYPDPDDPCFSASLGQPVQFLKNPAPDAGQDQAVCGQVYELNAGSSGFAGKWTQLSGPGSAQIIADESPVTAVQVPETGQYIFQWTETNGLCTGTDDVAIVFNPIPATNDLIESCNGANTAYAVNFTITQGQPPFIIDGLTGSINGADFLSNFLLNNQSYSFSITDANGCQSNLIEGAHNCLCATNAGTMSGIPIFVCSNQAAAAIWNNDSFLDSDDTIQFILHDKPGTIPGNIISTSSTPVFTFGPGIQTGVQYYISAVAGNNSGGLVDLSDICLAVAPGTPVQWKPLPQASIAADNATCAGTPVDLFFSGTGEFPLTITFSSSAGITDSVVVLGPNGEHISILPLSTITYTLLSIQDSGIPACSIASDSSLSIMVEYPKSSGTAAASGEVCAGENMVFDLASFLTGADPGGTWSEISASPSLSGGFDPVEGRFSSQNQVAGTYQFQYTWEAAGSCPGDSAVVEVQVYPKPQADAGPDKTLDCVTAEVLLGGLNSSAGPGIAYTWSQNGVTVPGGQNPFLPATEGGTYQLLVTNTHGCTITDDVTVQVTAALLSVPSIQINPVRCFGEKNGAILIDSVTGGTPPIQYTINGGPLGSNSHFINLKSGAYVISLEDAKGCTWQSDTLYLTEPPALKIDLGPDIEAALGDSLYLKVETMLPPTAIDTIIWHPLQDSAAAGTSIQNWLPVRSGRISVEVVDTNGCREQDNLLYRINRERQIYFPNVFNPEKTENNVFLIFGGQDVDRVEVLEIFDRWGERVFEASNFKAGDTAYGWPGTFRGSPAPSGVYAFYAVVRFVDGEQEIFTGSLTLLR